jgi:hypothetical protein
MEAKNHPTARRLDPTVNAFSSAYDALPRFPERRAPAYLLNRKQGPSAYAGNLSSVAFRGEPFPSREAVHFVILNDLWQWAGRDSTTCRNQLICKDLKALSE